MTELCMDKKCYRSQWELKLFGYQQDQIINFKISFSMLHRRKKFIQALDNMRLILDENYTVFIFGILNNTESVTSPIPILVTGHILRCDVIIDRIERIKIITTARQIFTDDPPLQLSVQAFDSEGTFHFTNFTGTLKMHFIENEKVMTVLCSWLDPQEILLAVWLA